MALDAAQYPTLLDALKMKRPDGGTLKVVETLMQRNPILKDAPVMEGNQDTGHVFGGQAALPSVSWVRINQGTPPSKGTHEQITETCGRLKGRSVLDEELARISGGPAYRLKNDRSFMSSMSNTVAAALFFASTDTTPEKILGLTPRFDALSGDVNSENIVPYSISGGSTDAINPAAPDGTDFHSIWFVTWGEDTGYLIFPKNTMAGIQIRDMGLEYEDDGTGTNSKFLAYRTDFTWRTGMCIEDWRYHARICNVDLSLVAAETTTNYLIHAMIEAYNRIRDYDTGNTVIYLNRKVLTALDRQIIAKANIWFSPGEWHGRPVTTFRGIPMVPCDALKTEESLVT
jgi:hypothetical protein